jgi:NADH-quinone oxidoreductase subunit M
MLEELVSTFPILTCILFLPVIGAVVLSLFDDEDMVRTSALTIALLELALCVFVLLRFIPESAAMQFSEHVPWIPALGVSYHLAVDGISVLFVGLTSFLAVLIVIYSWDTVRHQVKLYMMALLALETTTMGVFLSIDLILFFVFWELMLIPSYFLIKLWGGGAERHYAALKFVLYTLLGSVFMLVGIALLDINYHQWATLRHIEPTYSFDLLELLSVPIPLSQQILIFWLLFLGFAFKAPVFPFHTWLPNALLEGPIGMAVVLAGLKLGTFGFIRFSIPLLPDASKSQTVVTVIMALGLAAILYGAIMALIQQDFRRLLAFSSISHLGFVVIGLFALNYQGLQGSLLTMINLGFSTAGLFFIAGFLYSRQQNTQLGSFGGMAKQTPLLASFFLFIGLASMKGNRAVALAGLGFCALIVFLADSGGPVIMVAVAVVAWALWAVRRRMILVRWTIVGMLALLALVMKAPLWYLPHKFSGFVGGAGWHRSELIDRAIEHIDEWWLAGMPLDRTVDWFFYKAMGAVDITNAYLVFGFDAGLPAVLLFVALLVRAFRGLGGALATVRAGAGRAGEAEFLLWGLGATLAGHVANFFSITYWDQSYAIWFLHLAAMSGVARACTETAPGPVREATLGWWAPVDPHIENAHRGLTSSGPIAQRDTV